jgi:hypothetical protein
LIPDIEQFLLVAIFKMAATIPHKFNIVRFQRHLIWGRPFSQRVDCDPELQPYLKSDNVKFVRYGGGHFEYGDRYNFSMSEINSGHHNLPTYEMALKSDNVEFVRYCGGHFENGDR